MWQVIGHEWAVELLRRGLTNGRVAHAYLIAGPPQIGKRTLALNFAQALNCLGQEVPCGQCLSCRKIAHGNHPDVRLIEATGKTVKIEQIRAMQRAVSLSVHEGRWKVFILREMERATTEASNCLLKTLEEPPSRVILILTATETQALLPTIVSRCQVLQLRPLPIEMVQEALERRWEVGAERAELLARLSGGRLGWAVRASADEGILRQRESRLEEMRDLLRQGRVERLKYASRLSRAPEAMREALNLWLSWWRDLLLIKGGCPAQIANIDHQHILHTQAREYTLPQIKGFLRDLQAAIQQLEDNVNRLLALEVLMLHLPSNSNATGPESL